MRLQSLLSHSAASEGAVQLPYFLLKVVELKASAIAGSYINVLHSIYKVCSLENLCQYILEDIESPHNIKDWLKSRSVITTKNRAPQSINRIVHTKFPGVAVT